jgi:hypothetical protein
MTLLLQNRLSAAVRDRLEAGFFEIAPLRGIFEVATTQADFPNVNADELVSGLRDEEQIRLAAGLLLNDEEDPDEAHLLEMTREMEIRQLRRRQNEISREISEAGEESAIERLDMEKMRLSKRMNELKGGSY